LIQRPNATRDDYAQYMNRFNEAHVLDKLHHFSQTQTAIDDESRASLEQMHALESRARHVQQTVARLLAAIDSYKQHRDLYEIELVKLEQALDSHKNKQLRALDQAILDAGQLEVGKILFCFLQNII
jgi:phage-related tail protein